MPQKEKHLDYIIATITRVAHNSFVARGWSITLTTAILAVVTNTEIEKGYVLAIVPIVVFWIVDAYYLRLERKYRALFNMVREKRDEDIDFSMETSGIEGVHGIIRTALSSLLIFIYGSLIGLVVLIHYTAG